MFAHDVVVAVIGLCASCSIIVFYGNEFKILVRVGTVLVLNRKHRSGICRQDAW